ncbi:MAG TPA: hypothetical protein VFL13_02435 [Candidatus Baltobacteraceae bacterium]|nr:hypothetical protein [Candidatus Baltobacteraceae bacterium]
MNRLTPIALALLGVLAPLCASAEDTPNPNTFSDPAMSFTAPANFRRMQIPPHDPAQFEQKSIVAAYIKNPGTQEAASITISMENFEGSANGYSTSADNDIRGAADGVFIKRQNTTLSNGMPAVFEEITIGSGFAQMTEYRYLWADGVRGVELGETARYGTLDEKKAKADLALASAVAYPKNRY